MLKEGQHFTPTTPADGFCGMKRGRPSISMFSPWRTAADTYYGDWIEKPGAICSCNDGLRPVIFKVERTDEEATINYTPNHD